MSMISLSVGPHQVKRQYRKSIRIEVPPEQIPNAWREYAAMESLAPSNLLAGLARARTALLNSVPNWQLPTYLDQLEAAI